MKKSPFKMRYVLLLVSLPLCVGWLVSFRIFDWLETSNDWIGFWGGYLGGLCTLAGVIITINSSRADSDEKQRMSVIPYISIYYNASIDIDERKIPLGLFFAFSESRNDDQCLFFEEIKVVGKYKSVGLGPVINCGIRDIKIGERIIGADTSKMSVLTINDESYFILMFCSIGLSCKQLKSEFIKYYEEFWKGTSKQSRPPEISIEFYFYFEDVIGNKYRQKVIYIGQLSKPLLDIPDSLNILFNSISKPELIL